MRALLVIYSDTHGWKPTMSHDSNNSVSPVLISIGNAADGKLTG
jgi:hypothetical protein